MDEWFFGDGYRADKMMGSKNDAMEVIFSEFPEFWIGSNVFRRCKTIIQVLGEPMVEIVKAVGAGYEITFPVFDEDGTQLARVRGARIFPTTEGKDVGIRMRHQPTEWACERDGNTIFRLHRPDGKHPALRGAAELYAPTGVLITTSPMTRGVLQADELRIGDHLIEGAIFENLDVAIDFKEDGWVHLAAQHYTGIRPAPGA